MPVTPVTQQSLGEASFIRSNVEATCSEVTQSSSSRKVTKSASAAAIPEFRAAEAVPGPRFVITDTDEDRGMAGKDVPPSITTNTWTFVAVCSRRERTALESSGLPVVGRTTETSRYNRASLSNRKFGRALSLRLDQNSQKSAVTDRNLAYFIEIAMLARATLWVNVQVLRYVNPGELKVSPSECANSLLVSAHWKVESGWRRSLDLCHSERLALVESGIEWAHFGHAGF